MQVSHTTIFNIDYRAKRVYVKIHFYLNGAPHMRLEFKIFTFRRLVKETTFFSFSQ